MSAPAGRRLRRALAALASLAVVVVAYLGVTTAQVLDAAGLHQDGRAGAIVVLGSAQYDGRPSPDLLARLRHALDLWRRRVAPRMVVTGGREPGDDYTEAEVSADWLAGQGVPQASILREVGGRDTYQSLDATAAFLRARSITSVVLVSDAFHDARISRLAASFGLHAGVSPAPGSPIQGSAAVSFYAKEVAEVATARVIGWRRLNDLDEALGIAGT
ncbi:MAG TPA: YdcF family protein [Acidimicrobiales bacterium]|nr:YdcF family protein [Acidimicrobiales bacterium]